MNLSKMLSFKKNVKKNTITGNYGNLPFTVPYSEENLEILVKLQKNKVSNQAEYLAIWEEIKKLAEHKTKIENGQVSIDAKGKLRLTKEGELYIFEDFLIPNLMLKRYQNLVNTGQDTTPFVKLILRLFNNPFLNNEVFMENLALYTCKPITDNTLFDDLIKQGINETVAYAKSTSYEVPITSNGFFSLLKRAIPENTIEGITNYLPPIMKYSGEQFNCGKYGKSLLNGHCIRLQEIISLDNPIDNGKYKVMEYGLHVGTAEYVKGISGDLLRVIVAPEKVANIGIDNSVIVVSEYYADKVNTNGDLNTAEYSESNFTIEADKRLLDVLDVKINEYQNSIDKMENILNKNRIKLKNYEIVKNGLGK